MGARTSHNLSGPQSLLGGYIHIYFALDWLIEGGPVNQSMSVRFEVFTAVTMKNAVF
jgi:hypothetical protein